MALIRIGEEIELDTLAYELRRAGRAVRIERIPMEILLLLIERRPELVTREQIAERIWGRSVYVDTDNSINAAIFKIRQALRDDIEEPRFIRTITGKGYRFIGTPLATPTSIEAAPTAAATPAVAAAPAVQRRQPDPAEAPAQPGAAPHVDLPAGTRVHSVGMRWRIVAAAIILAGAAAGAWLYGSRSPTAASPAGNRLMLAVLPFDNLTGDPSQDYFSDGFTEEMIARVGTIAPERLGVIARTSVMYYKKSHAPPEKLRHDLGVQYILEGSVRRDAGRVRITAQLIRMDDQTHVWARQYDREETDLLRIQEEIARAIASQIELTLGEPRGAPRPVTLSPRSYEAYDHYLRGRYYWNQRTPEGLRRAIESFEQALAGNPDDARAHAGLADSYAMMFSYSYAPSAEVIPKARAAALRALEIDPDLAAAHTSLAFINEQHDWDWETAGERFRKAIALDPNYATAHHWYAEYLSFQGRADEALAEIDRARQLDPLSLIIATDRGAILYFARRYDEAVQAFRAVLEIEPAFPRANLILAPLVQQGRFDEALAHIASWRVLESGPWPRAWAAHIHGRLGRMPEARRALGEAETESRRLGSNPLWPRVVAQVGMGLREEVFDGLQQACAERGGFLASLKVEPFYDPLRNDPRFEELLRCARLAPEPGPGPGPG